MAHESGSEHTRIAAYGLIRRGNQMVLCRISKLLPQHEGRWTLPGGGVEFGEDPADTVVRECLEETGLMVRPLDVARIDSEQLDRGPRRFHAIRILYRVELLGGELRHELEGTTDRCAWLDRSEIDALELVPTARLGVSLAFEER